MEARSPITATDQPDAPDRAAGDAHRWLVVGEPSLGDQLAGAMPPDVDVGEVQTTCVPTFLAALGELGHGSAQVVVGPVSMLRGGHGGGGGHTADATAGALRALAPDAKLLVIADAAEADDADAALAAGFDGWVARPVTWAKLSRALTAGGPPERDQAAGDDAGGDPSAPVDGSGVGAGIGGDAPGDVDLIGCVLAGAGVRDAAMRVVRSRSAIRGVALARDTASVPPGHAHHPIRVRGRGFGVLHAPGDASSDAARDLAGWAGWLAHWLALDEQMALLKDLSMRDALTGVWNRRYFDRFLKRVLDWAGRERSQVTLLVFDIDDFKVYNDRYGHAAGDDILIECSKLMLSVVREHDVVARIGGDEFAVIFWDAGPARAPRKPNSKHPEDVVSAATRFQRAICSHRFPKLLAEAPGTLTISGGLASFPWDGRTPRELLAKADEMAMQSKRQGKNAIKFGPGAQRVCQLIQRD